MANIEIKIVEDPCVPVMLGYRPELDDPARPLLTITSVTRRRSIHMSEKQKPTPEELRARLTDEQFQFTQKAGTEAPFTGEYNDNKESGTYRCICCESELFSSAKKFDSGTGWPSFWSPAAESAVSTTEDTSHGRIREEVLC